jgi:6-phosphogluconolactonase (cycloisomerase 2 family)
MTVRTGLMAALVLGMLIGGFLAGSYAPLAFSRADEKGAVPRYAAGHPHYNVVATEGHNLIVTDNSTNTLYFYTIEREKPIGSELHLRGTVDLNQVGKPVIKPRHLVREERREK